MENESTPITAQENAERVADIITAQPILVLCGEKEYSLTPRTPHQLRAISKRVSRYSSTMAKSLLGLVTDDKKDEKKAADKFNNEALDYLIEMVQMLLDDKPTYDPKNPIIKKEDIDKNMDFVQIFKVLDAAAKMHDVTDLIAKTQRLRVL